MEKLILGQNAIFERSSEFSVNENILVCGGTGTGKTMSITEPRFLETTDTSLVCTVTKRVIVDKYRDLFEQRGYEILDLNLIEPDKSSCSFDPLDFIESFMDISFLSKTLMTTVNGGTIDESSLKDPYWNMAAQSLLSAEIGYVLLTVPNPSFNDVIDLNGRLTITEGNHNFNCSLDRAFDRLEKCLPGHQVIRWWKTFRQLPYSTASCIFSELNSRMAVVFTPAIQELFKKEKHIDFTGIGNHKTLLFISTSAVDSSQQILASMIYSHLFKDLHEYAQSQPFYRLPVPVHIICDEFATGAKIPDFDKYISIIRADGISVTILTQSESQLHSLYGSTAAATIINNCDSYVYFGGMDIPTVERLCKKANLAFEDLYYMPVGQEVVIRRGMPGPVFTERYQILNDARYQRLNQKYVENETVKLSCSMK